MDSEIIGRMISNLKILLSFILGNGYNARWCKEAKAKKHQLKVPSAR